MWYCQNRKGRTVVATKSQPACFFVSTCYRHLLRHIGSTRTAQ